jgi:hypothetical protein
MKNRTLTRLSIILVFITQCGIYAADVKQDNTQEETVPDIQFDKRIHDFGAVLQDEKVDIIYKIYNKGQDYLVIDKVRTTCGCTAALLSSKLIAPGEEGEIKATYDSKGTMGDVMKAIHVYSNDPDEGKVQLVIQGHVTSFISVRPRYVNFDEKMRGKSYTKKLKVAPLGPNDNFKVLKTETTLKSITTKFYPVDQTNEYIVELTLKPDARVGALDETLTIHTNIEKKSSYTVDIKGTVISAVKLAPRHLVFNLTNGEVLKKEIFVSHYFGEKIKIKELNNPLDYVSTQVVTIDEKSQRIVAHATGPSDTLGRIQGNMELKMDDPNEPEMKIFVQMNVRPEVRVVPGTLTMNLSGRTKDRSYTVMVMSHKESIKLDKVETDLEFLSIEEIEKLSEGKTYHIKVKPDPKVPVGKFNGKIVIGTNHSKFPLFEVPVVGNVSDSYLQ